MTEKIQQHFGLEPDGEFGPETAAVMERAATPSPADRRWRAELVPMQGSRHQLRCLGALRRLDRHDARCGVPLQVEPAEVGLGGHRVDSAPVGTGSLVTRRLANRRRMACSYRSACSGSAVWSAIGWSPNQTRTRRCAVGEPANSSISGPRALGRSPGRSLPEPPLVAPADRRPGDRLPRGCIRSA